MAARQAVQAGLPEPPMQSPRQFLKTQPTVSSKQVTQGSERPVPILMQSLVPGSIPSLLEAQSPVIFPMSFDMRIIVSAALVQAPIIAPVPVEPVALVVPPLLDVVEALPPAPVVAEAEPPTPVAALEVVVLVVAEVDPPAPVAAVPEVVSEPQAMSSAAGAVMRSRSAERDMGDEPFE